MIYTTIKAEVHVIFVSKLNIFMIYLYYRPFYRKPETPMNARFVYVKRKISRETHKIGFKCDEKTFCKHFDHLKRF